MTKKKPSPEFIRFDCKSCSAWEPAEAPTSDFGYCHLNPPQIISVDEDGNQETVIPITVHSQWCMQHRPKLSS